MEAILHINMDDPVNQKSLRTAIYRKWNMAVEQTVNILNDKLIDLLIRGGNGRGNTFRAFVDTSLWSYLNTPTAWGQLGFSDLQPLDDLVEGIARSMFMQATVKSPKSIVINLIDISIIAQYTEHPYAGVGQLPQGISWFVDWILRGEPIGSHRFVRTGYANTVARSRVLAGGEAGLMIAGGMWSFPPMFRMALDDWLLSNIKPIKGMVMSNLRTAFKRI